MQKNKTCGECKHYIAEMFHCSKNDVMAEAHNTCEDFEPKVITNGDKIIQKGNNGIAAFACGLLNDRSEETFQRVLSFLNAPAENEEEGWQK
jgi:hypothetical protein